MAKAILKSLDGVPEALAAEYQLQDDGSYKLKVESVNGFTLENVQGLKDTLSDQKEKFKKAQQSLSRYRGEDGELIDPSEFSNAKSALKDLDKMTPNDKVEAIVAQRVDEIVKKHSRELDLSKSETEKVREHLYHELIEGRTMRGLASMGAADAAPILMPYISQMLKVDDSGDKPEVIVLGENGNPRLSTAEGSTKNMSVDELLGELANSEKFSKLLPGSGKSGSDARTQQNEGGLVNGRVTISTADASDPQKYRAARAKADKLGVELARVD